MAVYSHSLLFVGNFLNDLQQPIAGDGEVVKFWRFLGKKQYLMNTLHLLFLSIHHELGFNLEIKIWNILLENIVIMRSKGAIKWRKKIWQITKNIFLYFDTWVDNYKFLSPAIRRVHRIFSSQAKFYLKYLSWIFKLYKLELRGKLKNFKLFKLYYLWLWGGGIIPR